MNRFAAICLLLLTVLVAPGAALADTGFDAGLQAYGEGDFTRAAELWRPAANAGDINALFYLGVLHDQGQGTPKDPGQAFRYYERAAVLGHDIASFNLGNAYKHGRGTVRSEKLATYWWQKAAELGVANAQFNLAIQYYRGLGVARDDRQAALYFNAAARNGHAGAEKLLATGRFPRLEGPLPGLTAKTPSGPVADGPPPPPPEPQPWTSTPPPQPGSEALEVRPVQPGSPPLAVSREPPAPGPSPAAPPVTVGVEDLGLRGPVPQDRSPPQIEAIQDSPPQGQLPQRQGALDSPVVRELAPAPTAPPSSPPPAVPVVPLGAAPGVVDVEPPAAMAEGQGAEVKPVVRELARLATPSAAMARSSPPAAVPVAPQNPQAAAILAPPATGDAAPLTGQRDLAWLAAQPPEHYSIQLAVMANTTYIESYLTSHRLRGAVDVVPVERDGKMLHYLLLGNFASKAEAEQRALGLAAEIRAGKPWVRRYGDIHQALEVR